MPVPDDSGLRQYFEQIGIAPRGMTFGHGIVIKDGYFARHLIAHELVHILQYERLGGIGPFLAAFSFHTDHRCQNSLFHVNSFTHSFLMDATVDP
jgi:hypothetical protein